MTRGIRHDDLHAGASFNERAQKFGSLVAGNATGKSQHDFFACKIHKSL
jgi:hypothetical protein